MSGTYGMIDKPDLRKSLRTRGKSEGRKYTEVEIVHLLSGTAWKGRVRTGGAFHFSNIRPWHPEEGKDYGGNEWQITLRADRVNGPDVEYRLLSPDNVTAIIATKLGAIKAHGRSGGWLGIDWHPWGDEKIGPSGSLLVAASFYDGPVKRKLPLRGTFQDEEEKQVPAKQGVLPFEEELDHHVYAGRQK